MDHSIYDVALGVGAVAGVIITLSTLGGRIKAACAWCISPFVAHKRQVQLELVEIRTDIRNLIHELKPNGGTSLRDAVNRIENRQIVFEQRQRAVLTDANVGVFETDESGEFVWVNRRLCRIMNRTPDELLGSAWLDAVIAPQRDSIEKAWETAVEDGREFHRAFTIATPDNTEVDLQLHCVRMTDKEGQVAGYIGFVTVNVSAGCVCATV
jgi:PAS domain S-box-containing protein